MATKKTILDEAEVLSKPSPKLKGPYSIGKTSFLTETRRAAQKSFTTQAHEASTYQAIIISVDAFQTKNPILGALLGTTEVETVVRAKVLGVHDHLPDPFKTQNPEGVIKLYPTFSGVLKKRPTVGSVATVAFYNNNNKNQQFGNGKLISVVRAAVEGGPEIPSPAPGKVAGSRPPSGTNFSCNLLEFLTSPPTDAPPTKENKNLPLSVANPEVINSSFETGTSAVKVTGAPSTQITGSSLSPQITGSKEQDPMKSFPPSCQKIYSVSDFQWKDGSLTIFPASGSKEDNTELPRWPVSIPHPSSNKGNGRITSYMQKDRKLRVTYRDERTGTVSVRDQLKNHNGIDIGIPVGTPCLATLDGTIVNASPPQNGTAGYAVIIRHDGIGGSGEHAIHSCYFHLSHVFVKTKHPDGSPVKVKRGACIGLTGGAKGMVGSGASTGPHLHWEIRRSRYNSKNIARYLNPVKFLETQIIKVGTMGGGL